MTPPALLPLLMSSTVTATSPTTHHLRLQTNASEHYPGPFPLTYPLARPRDLGAARVAGDGALGPPAKRQRIESTTQPPPDPPAGPATQNWTSDNVFVSCVKSQVFPHIDRPLAGLGLDSDVKISIAKKVPDHPPPSRPYLPVLEASRSPPTPIRPSPQRDSSLCILLPTP